MSLACRVLGLGLGFFWFTILGVIKKFYRKKLFLKKNIFYFVVYCKSMHPTMKAHCL